MHKRILCVLLVICLLGSVSALAADNGGRMTISEAGITLIKYYEGFRSQPYPDGTGYAIGYGSHVDMSLYPNGITEEQADGILRGTIATMEAKLYDTLLDKYNISLTQSQFDALMDLTYNISVSWMSEEYRLFNMLKSGISRYDDEEIINTFARYSRAGSSILDALVWRRLADAKVFLYGDYKFGGTQNYEYKTVDGYPVFSPEGGLTISKFSDVNTKMWAYEYISPLTFLSVVEGYPDGTFLPNSPVTCGEALKLILVSLGYGAQHPSGEHWASGYLTLAEGLGLIEKGSIVGLDEPISRLLTAKLAANAAELAVSAAASPFTDTTDPSVVSLYEAGIVRGSFNGSARLYKPDDSLSRGELCAIVWRLSNYKG
ncbi:MAG: S-layer homology domain-containing protein [Oscillospiraceae bacterium]